MPDWLIAAAIDAADTLRDCRHARCRYAIFTPSAFAMSRRRHIIYATPFRAPAPLPPPLRRQRAAASRAMPLMHFSYDAVFMSFSRHAPFFALTDAATRH